VDSILLLTNNWLLPNVNWDNMKVATEETIYMSLIALIFTFVIGIFLGLLLFLTDRGQLWQNKVSLLTRITDSDNIHIRL